MGHDVATFGAGCFWGAEAAFRRIDGVVDAAVGYMGGVTDAPTYEQVCRGDTGHAEVVQVAFDPTRVDYETLVRRFLELHDPTQLNRQGPDVGTQYRSVIFADDEDQEAVARRVLAELESAGRYQRPLATRIEPATTFHRAEEYHQRYLEKAGRASCGT